MGENTFPDSRGFVVDDETIPSDQEGEGGGVVCVVGKAKFESVKTGKAWDEQFIYRLSGFDEQGRIGHWVSPSSSAFDAKLCINCE